VASRLSECLKAPERMARVGTEASRMHDLALSILYPARNPIPLLRPLYCEALATPSALATGAIQSASQPGSSPQANGTMKLNARVGLHRPQRDSVHAREERRGGFYFYVPETWDGTESLPMIVALHGREQSGPGFHWRLMKFAASRGFCLLTPSSLGHSWGSPPPNWMLPDPRRRGANADVDNILSLIDDIRLRYPVDGSRTLLLGYCEGAQFALQLAAQVLFDNMEMDRNKFAAVALLCGTIPPTVANLPSGLRTYWVHGAHDAIFPCHKAKMDADKLDSVEGVSCEFREVKSMPHCFPPEDETRRMLCWFHECMMLPDEERPPPPPPRPLKPAEAEPEELGEAPDPELEDALFSDPDQLPHPPPLAAPPSPPKALASSSARGGEADDGASTGRAGVRSTPTDDGASTGRHQPMLPLGGGSGGIGGSVQAASAEIEDADEGEEDLV